jgi:prevent-host-death family protein
MLAVGVRELRNKLSHYLKRVKQGERIRITRRGSVIALLVPPPDRAESRRGLLKMVADGTVSWSGRKPRGANPLIKLPGLPLSETILEDRR